jgi:hypothetical protein
MEVPVEKANEPACKCCTHYEFFCTVSCDQCDECWDALEDKWESVTAVDLADMPY